MFEFFKRLFKEVDIDEIFEDIDKDLADNEKPFFKTKKSYNINDEYGIDINEIIERKRKEIELEDSKYDFPIKRSQAIGIANRNKNLKTDYCKNSSKLITYLSFNKFDVDVVEKNDRKYFQVQVKGGEISWVEDDSYYDGDLCYEGEDEDILRCLIDVETGEYIYYPKNRENEEEKLS